METNVNIIARNLFSKDSFEDVTEEQLLDYTTAFPFTGIGHFLLAKKKKDKGEPFQETAAKAALYFHNPLWLHFLLDDYPTEIETVVTDTIEAKNDTIAPAATILPEPEPIVEHSIIPAPEVARELSTETAREHSEDITVVPNAVVEKSPDSLEEPLFEPYHTIDYFASQGIRLRLEDLEKDAFGKQLKSFTEWLRIMKKIPKTNPFSENADVLQDPTDATIQKNAAESVEASEVETEAMAEVWIKQGKKVRAAAIYRKLSLLNPAKSHYFAAKIDQLNE